MKTPQRSEPRRSGGSLERKMMVNSLPFIACGFTVTGCFLETPRVILPGASAQTGPGTPHPSMHGRAVWGPGVGAGGHSSQHALQGCLGAWGQGQGTSHPSTHCRAVWGLGVAGRGHPIPACTAGLTEGLGSGLVDTHPSMHCRAVWGPGVAGRGHPSQHALQG